MTLSNHLLEINAHGQSIWMDNLARDLIESGALKRLVEEQGISGITSNPAIFEKAIKGNAIYDADIEAGLKAGHSVPEIYEALVFADIQRACDVLRPVYDRTDGLDGYVSIEVPPTIARDTAQTVQEARRYFEAIARPNVMIKIPGTPEGLLAVEQSIRAGLNVNVTLLFAIDSYVETFWAYIRGLEGRVADGQPIDHIASVASFFLSRIDTKVDQQIAERLVGIDDLSRKAQLESVLGKVAIANAKVAYQKYKEILASDRWQALAARGAKVQRLLWASTSTKNPQYSDVMYVDSLVGPDTVNTLPPETIEACVDHCDVGDRLEQDVAQAQTLIATLPELGIDLDQVMAELLEEGIDKFVQPFNTLMQSLEEKVHHLSPV
ncbi:transaldolase [Geitlerinema sp. PCC 7407]|uniref:transaldolase n=1 Tax=Geitlerinema sp. PCC 7407 TaxID=1173025 RepID=UPI00029FCE13|nr:transaldolase [Geitlerinema sp. PCC 7407]AFY65227.1 transaldolase [Geitlerinema sp. PCC 7407]